MIAGDLPPSSSVTGVRLAACRAHHVMADGGGSGEQQMVERQRGERLRDLGIAVDHDDFVRARNIAPPVRRTIAEKRGVNSLIFTITRLPATSASTSGPTARYSG